MLKNSLKVGLSFGLTSGIITTLGLMVGLYSGTHSKMVTLGGILTIAIADAFSDALGIHVSEESQKGNTVKAIWESTIATFIAKFIFAIQFVVPVLIFPLHIAIIFSICWGLLLISIFSYFIAREQKVPSLKVILEHLFIGVLVIIATHLVGSLISSIFQ